MSQHYHNGQAQTPYNFFHHRSTDQLIHSPHTNGLPQATGPQSHTLPPQSLEPYRSAHDHHAFATRQTAMLMTSQAEGAGQPGTYPVYAPTANIFFNPEYSSNASTQHIFERQHQPQHSSQPSSFLMHQPGYAAPPRNLPEIAPMPSRHNGDTMTIFSNGTGHPQSDEKPSHVVGAQGRRGILPSSAGRPPAQVGDSTMGSKNPPTPVKDANGKYPCVHCEKTYLHAKHLKRHLLRHSGVRPYTCGLCNDTFSRSDILKRHFTKCSTRRGNPTGQNHLEYSRSKKEKRRRETEAKKTVSPDASDQGQLGAYTPTSMESSLDMTALSLNQPNQGGASNQVSRANSFSRSKRSTENHSNHTSIGMMNASGYESAGYAQSSGDVTPDSVSTSGVATPYAFNHEARTIPNGSFTHANGDMQFAASSRPPTSSAFTSQTSLPHILSQDHGRGYSMDWSHLSQFGNHEDYNNQQAHSGANTPLERDKRTPDFSNLSLAQYSCPNHRT